MGSVNVNRNVSDAFYRYKMPRLMAKVEGKGNGIKTVIVNMAEVAKAIGRPATCNKNNYCIQLIFSLISLYTNLLLIYQIRLSSLDVNWVHRLNLISNMTDLL